MTETMLLALASSLVATLFGTPLEIAQGIRPVVDAEMIEIREE